MTEPKKLWIDTTGPDREYCKTSPEGIQDILYIRADHVMEAIKSSVTDIETALAIATQLLL